MGLIQGGTGVFFVHRQLLAVGGGEGVAAVGVDTHGPDVGLGITGELAIGQGHVGALVIEAGVLRGQGLAVGGVEYHHLVAVGYGGNDAAFLNFEECLGKQSFVAADGAEGTPVVLLGIPLQIAATAHVLNVVAALGGSLLQCPGGVGLVQGSAGVFFVHGQLLAVGGGEGIAAIVVDAYGPDVGLSEAGQLAAGEGHVGALVIEAAVLAGQGLEVCGVVDDHLVAVLQRSGGILRLARLRGLGHHQIKLLGKQSLVAADGSVGAPIVLLGEPLQIAAAAHVLDVEAVRRGGSAELPIHIGLVQGGAAVAGVHGQLLALGGGEGIGAALGAVHGPQLCIRVAGELATGQLHIHARVIEAVVHGGQSLFVGGVEHHHLVAVLQGGQIGDDAALAGGGGAELPEAQGLPGDIGVDRSVAAPILVVVHAHIAGQCHVLQIAGLRVHHPVAVFAGTLADAVVAAGGIQVLAGGGGDQLEAVSALDDLPAEQVLLRCGQRIAADGTGDGLGRGLGVAVVGQHPGAVALGHGNGDGVVGRDIGQLHLRPCPCLRLCREYRHRQQGNQHDQ